MARIVTRQQGKGGATDLKEDLSVLCGTTAQEINFAHKLGFVPPSLSHCCVPSMKLSFICLGNGSYAGCSSSLVEGQNVLRTIITCTFKFPLGAY